MVTFLVALLLMAITVTPRLLKYRAAEKKARLKLRKTDGTEQNVAVAMHPRIDLVKCIGCGSCVKACPEADVLGIIAGKATLIHAAKCVGHALCAEECPVGAITMAVGSPGRNAEMPMLDEHLQTTLPGMYIAGELGGMGLIKNAMTEGIRAVEHIASHPVHVSKNGHLDLVIIGAGPAGLAAALTAKKHNLNFHVLEQGDIGGTILQYPRRKIVMTAPVELPLYGKLSLTETTKESLLETWNKIIDRADLRILTNQKVVDVKNDGNGFSVKTQDHLYEACHVVLAVGRRGTPRKLGVSGENLSKVSYRLIEAESYENCHLLVVGGGDSAVEAAVALASQKGNHVTLSYRKAEFTRIKDRNTKHLQEAERKGTLKIIFESEVKEIRDKFVIIQKNDQSLELPNDYVFVFAGGELPYDFLRKIGVGFHSEAM